MHIKFSLFEINTKYHYNLKQLVEFENSESVRAQKCKTSIILLTGFILYSIVATFFPEGNYYHGKVTNISLALFFLVMIFLIRIFKRHTYLTVLGAYGTNAILFFHLITEVDWTIGMDAYWLFVLIMPFITNFLAGVVYGTVSALSGYLLSVLLFDTSLINYLQPYGKNMVEWFPIIYIVVMMVAAVMEYELTAYQIAKKESDEKIAFYQKERTKRLQEELTIYESNEITIRKYKHDIRHFNRVLAGFIKDEEYTKALDYLTEFDSMLEKVTAVSFCENRIVNEILTIYASKCQKAGFKLRAKAAVPERFPIQEVELTSLVANALENALEAQEKLPKEKRFIQFEITYDDRRLKILSKNSCEAKPKFNENGLPVSTKPVRSGIGTSQISEIAKKYGGAASFSYEKGMFILKAVMTCM